MGKLFLELLMETFDGRKFQKAKCSGKSRPLMQLLNQTEKLEY